MLTAVVTQSGGDVVGVLVVSSEDAGTGTAAEVPASEPNPIAPDMVELAWAAGAFLVLFALMRTFLFPRLKKGMDARYAGIRGDHEAAELAKSSARSDVAEYEAALAAARAEAAATIDAARATLETERQAQIAEANGRIAARRAEADQQVAAARAAVRGQIADAVASVVTSATVAATGRTPDAGVVSSAVAKVMEGAAR